ncbi:MAG: alpha/beta fold hydrolase [Oscillospiraceae bacterium]|nr:alpha/beta fold hydrolase [Oscillospiraceae bacterium]
MTDKTHRRLPTLGKAVKTLLVFLFSFFVISVCLTLLSQRLAFGRRDAVPPTELRYEESSAGARERVSFPSGGNTLRGWLYGEDGARGLVIVVHGLGGGADSFLPEIERFVAEGYAVLSYDGTGTRSSDGAGVRGLPQAREDLEAALRYVAGEERLRALPLYLYGHSAGGYAVARVLPEHPEVAGAVCLAAFDRPVEEMLYQAREKAGLLSALGEPFLRASCALLFGKDADASAAGAVALSSAPVLIAAGRDDETVPYRLSLLAASSAGEGRTLLLLDGAHDDLRFDGAARAARAALLAGEPVDRRACCILSEQWMSAVLALFSSAEEADLPAAA